MAIFLKFIKKKSLSYYSIALYSADCLFKAIASLECAERNRFSLESYLDPATPQNIISGIGSRDLKCS